MKSELTARTVADLRAMIEQTRNSRVEFGEKLAAAEAERSQLLSAPLNRADLEAVLVRDIAAQQAAALENEELLAEFRYTQARGIQNQILGDAASSSPFVAGKYSQSVLDRLVFAMGDPANILQRLKPALDKIDFRKCGPALAERKNRLAAVEKTIAGLRAELAEIDSVLRNAEPNVHHPIEPKVGERRELSPGQWAVWQVMPHSGQGFWQPEGQPVFRGVPEQPIGCGIWDGMHR